MTTPGNDHEQPTVDDLLALMRRVATLPRLPEKEDPDWAAKVLAGEAPYGRCAFCGAARGPMTCLNLCELPSGHARAITDGVHAALAGRRAQIRFLEALAGCTCPEPRLSGYQIERDAHESDCRRIRGPIAAR